MRMFRGTMAAAGFLALLAVPGKAFAQLASENAVTSADDAFGTTVGVETSGIYSESDTRGFSPKLAGNVRIDGIYFDQVSTLSGRLREGSAIRVGFAAAEYPFHAPTGVVDVHFRKYPQELGASVAVHRTGYWGSISEWDLRIPIVKDHIALTGGAAHADQQMTDGSGAFSVGVSMRPIFRYGGVEFAPFLHKGWYWNSLYHPLVVVRDGYLPKLPPKRKYLGQRWAEGRTGNFNGGATLKASITDALSLRAGLFHSAGNRVENYTEIFSITSPQGLARHVMLADPRQDIHSTSGEALAVLRLQGGDLTHRIFAGYRARNRLTETGGSDFRDYGQVTFGQRIDHPEEKFTFFRINSGRVKQGSLMLGYIGKLDGVGTLNLGIQRNRYRAANRDGRTGLTARSATNTWLYNATLAIDVTPALSFYAGSERGLEDSGTAPENAVNRNDQLPAARSTQYEAGARWKFNGGQLVVNAFQITKPYFSFDQANHYERLGSERHRGIEASVAGQFGKRLNLVAGVVAMQPRVTGEARRLGLVGSRPAKTPSLFARVDLNYRTDLLGELTPTATIIHTGKRAAGSRPLAALDGRQLMVGGYTTVDLGLRLPFRMGRVPASIRAVAHNVFDAQTWKVIAADTLQVEERRNFTLILAADF